MKTDELTSIIIGFIIDGNAKRDIVEWISIKHPDIESPSDLYDDAMKRIHDIWKDRHKYDCEIVNAGLHELYRRATEIGDYKVAADILVKIHKLS